LSYQAVQLDQIKGVLVYKIQQRKKDSDWLDNEIGLSKGSAEKLAKEKTVKYTERLGWEYRVVKDIPQRPAGSSLALSQLLNK
jgi:hypothetical protein